MDSALLRPAGWITQRPRFHCLQCEQDQLQLMKSSADTDPPSAQQAGLGTQRCTLPLSVAPLMAPALAGECVATPLSSLLHAEPALTLSSITYHTSCAGHTTKPSMNFTE